MDPLIKWPGGKSREINIISEHIPQYHRYIEPFFGGGAVGFNLKPTLALVNDLDKDLIKFYTDIQNQSKALRRDLEKIYADWTLINELQIVLRSEFTEFLEALRDVAIEDIKVNSTLDTKSSPSIQDIGPITSKLKYVDHEAFYKHLEKSISSKLIRAAKLERKHQIRFDQELIDNHLLTAIKSAYYTQIRDDHYNVETISSTFFFIREFCYGSMFRYNSAGGFNIPYGGINYNYKDFGSKIQRLFSSEVQLVLDRFELHSLDFEEFLDDIQPTSNDFIFLDPPYDSDFKNYNNHVFTEADQSRLAQYLSESKAKWMLVIQKSQLISELYEQLHKQNSRVKILDYDKLYTYNVRGRNKRETSHLLIKNY